MVAIQIFTNRPLIALWLFCKQAPEISYEPLVQVPSPPVLHPVPSSAAHLRRCRRRPRQSRRAPSFPSKIFWRPSTAELSTHPATPAAISDRTPEARAIRLIGSPFPGAASEVGGLWSGGDGRRALEAAGARRARSIRAGLLPRRDPEVASPLARYVGGTPGIFSTIAACITAASWLQTTPGGFTDYARDHLQATWMCVKFRLFCQPSVLPSDREAACLICLSSVAGPVWCAVEKFPRKPSDSDCCDGRISDCS